MTTLQKRLQEAMEQVKLGMDEVEEVRDRCLQEMKGAISDMDIKHMSGNSSNVCVIVRSDNRTKAILQEYEEAHRQILKFIEMKHTIREALL